MVRAFMFEGKIKRVICRMTVERKEKEVAVKLWILPLGVMGGRGCNKCVQVQHQGK